MWCEIHPHTLLHRYEGYWSVFRVERLRQNRHDAGETSLRLVLGRAERPESL